MAHQTPVASWLFSQRQALGVRFVEMTWPARYYEGLFDFEVKISAGDCEVIGRGIDSARNLALEKASAEAIERWICRNLGIESEGFAVSGAVSSGEHAKMEMLERYFFAQHLADKKKFLTIIKNAELWEISQTIVNRFSKNENVQVSFWQMNTSKDVYGIFCIATDGLSPISLGLSLCKNPESAIQRSFTEALMNIAAYLDGPEAFTKEQKSMNAPWNIRKSFLEEVMPLLDNQNSNFVSINEPSVFFEEIDYSGLPELSGCPIKPIRCLVGNRS